MGLKTVAPTTERESLDVGTAVLDLATRVDGLLSHLRADAPAHVLGTEVLTIGADGYATKTWTRPFLAVFAINLGSTQQTVTSSAPADRAPTKGPGITVVQAGCWTVVNMRGDQLTVHGAVGDTVFVETYLRPQPPAAGVARAGLLAADGAGGADFVSAQGTVAHTYIWNGASWSKSTSAGAVADNNSGALVLSSGLYGFNGATWDRLRLDANKRLLTASAPPGNVAVINDTRNAQAVTYVGPDVAVDAYANLAVDINVNTLTGTGPTAQLIIDRKGADGVYYPISTGAALNAAGSQSTSIGPGCTVPQAFGTIIRYRVVIGGVGPSASWTLSVYGR